MPDEAAGAIIVASSYRKQQQVQNVFEGFKF
jgi:hypothetical protein